MDDGRDLVIRCDLYISLKRVFIYKYVERCT